MDGWMDGDGLRVELLYSFFLTLILQLAKAKEQEVILEVPYRKCIFGSDVHFLTYFMASGKNTCYGSAFIF